MRKNVLNVRMSMTDTTAFATSPARSADGISATRSVKNNATSMTIIALTRLGIWERLPAASVAALREALAPIGMPELNAAAMFASPIGSVSEQVCDSVSAQFGLRRYLDRTIEQPGAPPPDERISLSARSRHPKCDPLGRYRPRALTVRRCVPVVRTKCELSGRYRPRELTVLAGRRIGSSKIGPPIW